MNTQLSLLKNHIPPLSEKMRPKNLDEIVGQEHLLNKNSVFRKLIESDKFSSIILWGPPGTGKTTLANIIANQTNKEFIFFHASFNGIKDIKDIVKTAQNKIEYGGKGTILFVDEIHRFNKTQQDAFLKPVEQGIINLIGATTENPSFSTNSALLSRCSVYILKQLQNKDLEKIIDNTLNKLKTNSYQILIDDDAKELLINYSNGDARNILNALEIAVNVVKGKIKNCDIITKEIIKEILSTRKFSYNKNSEEHYNLLSALQKSIRGSDVNAAVYWLSKMLESGADPLVILRRLVVIASEDIGLADPDALVQAIATQQAVNFLGYPECRIAMSQLVIYLATAPKSNSAYQAINKASKDVLEDKNEPVPINICNAPTKFMQNLGYGKNYKYDHEYKYHYAGQKFLPESLKNKIYYSPGEFGFEKEIKKRIDFWKMLKDKNNG
ncbi:AAA family ATPase [Candidatus Dependentiae bacterium]|nr:AAA family ATPase [Candidatus Dependentiae bacterium]